MLQCRDCEHFVEGPGGQVHFACNPFTNIKEPECLQKWQLIKTDTMVRAYQATLAMYQKYAPLQEKMFKHMEKEMDDIEEGDAWKMDPDDEEEPDGPGPSFS
jgi:hypothetical protein